ncbi:MAG: CapA family protein [bacterium]|nr:CapA family protein [bacterium]
MRPREALIIHGIGDVALDPVYIPTFPSEGYGYAWSGLGGIFQRDDLTVINMECAVSDLGDPVPKAFNFRCDPAALPSALEAGVDVANLANNHALDFGREALVDSVANLRAAGIHPVGAGSDYEEAYRPALLEIRGWKIAVLGFGGVLSTRSWLATEDRPGIASGDDRADMVAAVERAAEIADLVIVTIHWGMQLDTQPRPDDIAHAEAMVAAGADIIFGHHQHRVGPLGEIDGKPVAWGLGHIVWRRINPVSAQTTVAKVVVLPDGTMGACLMPAEIVRHGHPVFVGQTPGHCDLLYGGRPSPMEPPSIMF